MRVMAFDIGEKRVGIAISDPKRRIASPLCVIPTSDIEQNSRRFKDLLTDWDPGLLLIGLPLSLSNENTEQTKWVRKYTAILQERCDIPLDFIDERLSSVEAKNIMRENGYNEKSMRGKIDMVAASCFLQKWLDHKQSEKTK